MSSTHSIKTNLSFSGGGTASITIGTGVITALVKNIQENTSRTPEIEALNDNVAQNKNALFRLDDTRSLSFTEMQALNSQQIEETTTLGSYLGKHVNVVGGNSGGSWFHTLMQYSPAFFHMLNNGCIAQGSNSIPNQCTDTLQKMKYDSDDYYRHLSPNCNGNWIGDDRAHSDSGRSRYFAGQTAWDYCSDLSPLEGQGRAPPPMSPQNSTRFEPCNDASQRNQAWNVNGTTSACAKVDVETHYWRPDEYEYSCRCPVGYGWSDEGYGTMGAHHATGKCNMNCSTIMNIARGDRRVPTFKDYIVRHFSARRDPTISTFQSDNSTLEYILRVGVGHRRPGPCLGDGGCAINNNTDDEMLRYFYWFLKTPWSQVVTEMVFKPADTMVGINYNLQAQVPAWGILGREISRPVVDGTNIVYAGVAMEDSFVTPTLMSHLFFPTCCPDDQLTDEMAPNMQCVQDYIEHGTPCGAGFPVTFNYNNIKEVDLHGTDTINGELVVADRSHCPMYPGPGIPMYQYENYTNIENPVMIGQPQILRQLKNPVSPDVQAVDIASIAGAAGALTASAPYLMNVGDKLAQNLGPEKMGVLEDLLGDGIGGIEFTELKNILSGAQRGVGLDDYINGRHPSWKIHLVEIMGIATIAAPIIAPIAGAGYVSHKVSGGASSRGAGRLAAASVATSDMEAATRVLKNALVAISKLLVEEAILVQFNVPSGHLDAGSYNYEFSSQPRPPRGQKSMRVKGAVCTDLRHNSWTGCSPISVQRVSNNQAGTEHTQNPNDDRNPTQLIPDTDAGLMEHLSFRFGDGGYSDNTGVVHAIAAFQHANKYGVRGSALPHADEYQERLDEMLCYHGVHVGKDSQRDWTANKGSCNPGRNTVHLNADDMLLFGCRKPDGGGGGLNGCVSASVGPSDASCVSEEQNDQWEECSGTQRCFNYLPSESGGDVPPINVILPECLSRDPSEISYTHIWSGYKKLQKHKFEWYGGEYAEGWPDDADGGNFSMGYSDMTDAQKKETTWWNQANFMNISHVRTVTVDNPAFGIKAGMKVELYIIHVQTACPTFPDPRIENVTGVNTYTISAFDIAQLMDAALKDRPGLLENAFFNTSNLRIVASQLNNRTGPDGSRTQLEELDTWRSSLSGPGQLDNPVVLPPDQGRAP